VKEITKEEAERLKRGEEPKKQEEPKPQVTETKSKVSTTSSSTSKNDKEEEKKEEYKGEKPNAGCGGVGPNYWWTQRLEDVTINIPVEDKIRGRDLKIEYTSKTIFVGIKGGATLLAGDLCSSIKTDSFVWVLETNNTSNSKVITITFEKFAGQSWWECIIKGHTKIDTSKVNPEPSKLSDLDPEMRSQGIRIN